MSYEFVKYSPSFKAQVVSLRSRVFGGTESFNAAYFEWKYEQNPYLGQPHLCLALDNGRVIGMRGAYGCRWGVGGAAGSIVIPSGGDFAVDVEHRGRGLGPKILVNQLKFLAAEGFKYVFSMSAGRTTRLLQLRCRWKRAATYQTWCRERTNSRPSLFVRGRRKLRRILRGRSPDTPFRRFDSWAATASGSLHGTSEALIAEMSKLVGRCGKDSRIEQVRDASYYQWRLAFPQTADSYRFIFYEQGGSVEGFFVLLRPTSNVPLKIIDWATSSPSIWAELVHATVDNNHEPIEIACTAFSPEQVRLLSQLDFKLIVEPDSRINPAPGVFLRALPDPERDEWSLGGNPLFDENSWNMRMIFSDASF